MAEKIQNLDRLLKKLAKLQKQYDELGSIDCEVSYESCEYAVYVHEDMHAKHTNGQAKFLEQPARTMRSELAQIFADNFKRTGDFKQSLLAAGLALQEASQALCPVKTGTLKGSAVTRIVTK